MSILFLVIITSESIFVSPTLIQTHTLIHRSKLYILLWLYRLYCSNKQKGFSFTCKVSIVHQRSFAHSVSEAMEAASQRVFLEVNQLSKASTLSDLTLSLKFLWMKQVTWSYQILRRQESETIPCIQNEEKEKYLMNHTNDYWELNKADESSSI